MKWRRGLGILAEVLSSFELALCGRHDGDPLACGDGLSAVVELPNHEFALALAKRSNKDK